MILAEHKGVIELREKNQITLPATFVKSLDMKKGDQFECRVTPEGHLVLIPVITVPKDQAWFWTEKWQAMEREASAQIAKGNLPKAKTADALLEEIADAKTDTT